MQMRKTVINKKIILVELLELYGTNKAKNGNLELILPVKEKHLVGLRI